MLSGDRTAALTEVLTRNHDEPAVPLLSVIIPVFNEASSIFNLLNEVVSEQTHKEILLIDDGSSDNTPAEIRRWFDASNSLNLQTERVVWLTHTKNRGKGAAIRTGLSHARGRYVSPLDADFELSPSSFEHLLVPLLQQQAEIVIGFRSNLLLTSRLFHTLGIRILNRLIRMVYGYSIRDAACCFKVLSLKDYKRLSLEKDGFDICEEIIAKSARLGLTLSEIEVTYQPRRIGTNKKLRLIKDGVQAIITTFRYSRWNHCNAADES